MHSRDERHRVLATGGPVIFNMRGFYRDLPRLIMRGRVSNRAGVRRGHVGNWTCWKAVADNSTHPSTGGMNGPVPAFKDRVGFDFAGRIAATAEIPKQACRYAECVRFKDEKCQKPEEP